MIGRLSRLLLSATAAALAAAGLAGDGSALSIKSALRGGTVNGLSSYGPVMEVIAHATAGSPPQIVKAGANK